MRSRELLLGFHHNTVRGGLGIRWWRCGRLSYLPCGLLCSGPWSFFMHHLPCRVTCFMEWITGYLSETSRRAGTWRAQLGLHRRCQFALRRVVIVLSFGVCQLDIVTPGQLHNSRRCVRGSMTQVSYDVLRAVGAVNALNRTGVAPCPPGDSCSGGVRTPCPQGAFSGAVMRSFLVGAELIAATAMHVTVQVGASVCTPCPAMSFGNATGQSACYSCLPGFACPTAGATSSSACAAGRR